MTKEEFASWADDMYEKLNNEKRLSYSINSAKGICVIYTTDTYESLASNFDKDNVTTSIAVAYAKFKEIEIPLIEETPTLWRAEQRGTYYYVHNTGTVEDDVEIDHYFDNENYKFGNYFKTREQAESAHKKIKHLLKLQRLHDMLCPDYEPDWTSSTKAKFYIIHNENKNCYVPMASYAFNSMAEVYFTEEAADKACEILNKEKEND